MRRNASPNRFSGLFAFVVLSLSLVACAPKPFDQAGAERKFERKLSEFRARQISLETAISEIENKTRRSFNGGHGTQISYGAPDGRYYLWYPGNDRILSGEWKMERKFIAYMLYTVSNSLGDKLAIYGGSRTVYHTESGARNDTRCRTALRCVILEVVSVCYRYDRPTYNPQTRTRAASGEFQCWPYYPGRRWNKETTTGDVLGLAAKATVPFKLAKSDTTIAALKAKIFQSDPDRLQP